MEAPNNEETAKPAGAWRGRWFWRGLALLVLGLIGVSLVGLPEFASRAPAPAAAVHVEAFPPPAAAPMPQAAAPEIVEHHHAAPPPGVVKLAPPSVAVAKSAAPGWAVPAWATDTTKLISFLTLVVGGLAALVSALAKLLHEVTHLRKEWAGLVKG